MPTSSDSPKRIGLIAAWGRYPLIIAEALREQGYEVYCLGVVGHADRKLAEVCTHFQPVGLCRFGAACRYFRRHGVTEAMMAGKIHKVVLFTPWRWFRHFPDWTTIRAFAPHFWTKSRNCADDSLLETVVAVFAEAGVEFKPATDYAPKLLVKEGRLTRRSPSPAEWKDIAFGWEIAKELGRLDIGQSVCVKDQAVMALEAIEGTDKCILRAGELCRTGGFTVVKVAKPEQDMRYDVPTVGLRTLKNMLAGKSRVLALEADRAIILDEPEVVDFANRHDIAIVSIKDGAAAKAA